MKEYSIDHVISIFTDPKRMNFSENLKNELLTEEQKDGMIIRTYHLESRNYRSRPIRFQYVTTIQEPSFENLHISIDESGYNTLVRSFSGNKNYIQTQRNGNLAFKLNLSTRTRIPKVFKKAKIGHRVFKIKEDKAINLEHEIKFSFDDFTSIGKCRIGECIIELSTPTIMRNYYALTGLLQNRLLISQDVLCELLKNHYAKNHQRTSLLVRGHTLYISFLNDEIVNQIKEIYPIYSKKISSTNEVYELCVNGIRNISNQFFESIKNQSGENLRLYIDAGIREIQFQVDFKEICHVYLD